MSLHWRKNDYFQRLLEDGPAIHSALELLVDDLHRDKSHTIGAFLAHYGSEDFLWALVRMLVAENTRVAGNAAYIFGTLAENQEGQMRVLSIVNGSHPQTILPDLTNMLEYDDDESVMNAAGTLGTLAESSGGREWMIKEQCLDITISRITGLLNSNNMWTASNAALVLARLSIAEEGCQHMLDHSFSHQILTKLIDSLGIDEAGRGMNAAFALGRLCDLEAGRTRLLQHPDSEKMISRLCNMLSSKDFGCGKNACYTISCLATSSQGHDRLLGHSSSEVMLQRLGSQLSNEDSETAWFAAMTLRTLASKRKGCLRLRDHPQVVPALQITKHKDLPHQDLKEEVELTLELLKTLDKPGPPSLQVKGHAEVQADWEEVTLKSGLEVTYRLYNDSKLVYEGKSTSHLVTSLRADTQYSFSLQLSTEGDDSPISDVALATTEEAPPDPPESLRILAVTTSQLKLGWTPPGFNNGALKGYVVYNGKQQVETTTELSSIVSGLAPGTTYDLHVCAFNHKGKGPKATITATTTELGKHAPGKPSLTIRGRSEIHVTWAPPEFPLGRLHRFELTQNGKVIYSGTDLNYTAHRLTPNTDYRFTVIAVTSEGKCESDAAKKKTPKDEYNVQSTAPIFFSHPARAADQESAGKTKEKSSTRVQNKNSNKRISSAMQRHLKHPVSPTSTEPPSVRSSSRPSSAFSNESFHSKKQTRRKRSVSLLDKKASKASSTMAPLAEWHAGRHNNDGSSSQSEDDDDMEDEEERWPGAVSQEVSGSDHYNTFYDKKPTPKEATSSASTSRLHRGHTESKRKISTENESSRQSKTERSNSDEVKSQSKGHSRLTSKETNPISNHSNQGFNSREASQQKQSKKSSKHKRLSGNHSANESDPATFKLDRLLRSLKSSTKHNGPYNSGLTQRGLGPGKDSLHRAPTSATWDPRQSSSLGTGSHLPTQDLRLEGVTSSREQATPREIATSGKEFTLLANGQIVFRDARSGSGSSKKSSSSEALTTKTEKKSAKDKKRSSSKPQPDVSLQPLYQDDKGLPPAEQFVPVFPWEGGEGSKVNSAPPASWITQTKPSLKKNLAKLASYPGAFHYEPEFPSSKPVIANRYQFIPTQFRTQPTNLPGQPAQRGTTSTNLYDKSTYSKKLDTLAQMTIDRKTGVLCQDCGPDGDGDGRTTPKQTIALKYSHRNDITVSVGRAKTSNSVSTTTVPDIVS